MSSYIFFFFNDTATTEIYTLSLHDALPICPGPGSVPVGGMLGPCPGSPPRACISADRKSTRLNSSHQIISYAVFCLKKKTQCIVYDITGTVDRTSTTRTNDTPMRSISSRQL